MKRRQFTRADKGQAALLEEIRGMRSELRKMCGLLRVWEMDGLPAERVALLPPDAAAAVEEIFGKLPSEPSVPCEASKLSAEAASVAAGRSSVVFNPIDRDAPVIVDLESEIKRLRRLLLETGLPEEPGQPS